MRRGRLSKVISRALLAASVVGGALSAFAADEPARAGPTAASANSSLYVKVQLDKSVKLSKLKPGDVVEGKLARDVYSSDRELFPAGSPVRLAGGPHGKKKKDSGRSLAVGSERLHSSSRAISRIQDGDRLRQQAAKTPCKFRSSQSAGSARYMLKRRRKPGEKTDEAGAVEVSRSGGLYGPGKLAAPMMVLEAFGVERSKAAFPATLFLSADLSGLETLPPGTACKILLLGNVSASKSKPGDVVQARLLEPVLLNSRVVLPAGSAV